MIDEDGRPRPIDVRIDAGVRIEGKGDVVAEKGVVEGRGSRVREMKRGGGIGGLGSDGNTRKRRASSVPAGGREGKRERMD